MTSQYVFIFDLCFGEILVLVYYFCVHVCPSGNEILVLYHFCVYLYPQCIVSSYVLLISDNALLVQSRFMLMEGMMIFFSCLSVMSFLKFRGLSHRYVKVKYKISLSLVPRDKLTSSSF